MVEEKGKTVAHWNDPDSMNGVSDEELLCLFQEAVRIQNEIKRIMGGPICKYDAEQRRAYLEYPDGRVQYAAG